MTLHISLLSTNEIVVVMDSLGTSTDVRSHFQKCWAPSGGRFILAGTGVMEVVNPWLRAAASAPTRSVDQILEVTGPTLSARWLELAEQHGLEALAPTTAWLYYFDRSGNATRAGVSSRDNFEVRSDTSNGLRVSPMVPDLPLDLKQFGNTDPEYLTLAQHILANVRRSATGTTPVEIGGRVSILRLPRVGVVTFGNLGMLD